MKRPVMSALLATTLLMLSLSAFAQERLTEHTLKLNSGKTSPPATIADMSWLAGHWIGDAFGGSSDEIWSPPRNGGMIGMYRLIKDGKPIFYELISLVEEGGSLIFRLKHFNPNMSGWEEKDKTIDFPLVAKENGVIHFEGMSFKPEGKDAVTIFLAIRNKKDGGVREEVIRYTRGKQDANP